MMKRAPIACLLVLVACGKKADAPAQPKPAPPPPVATDAETAETPTMPTTPATPTTPSTTTKTVKVPMFSDVAIEDGAIHLMDGGIHGIQGHTLVIPASGDVKWERRLDGMQPNGKAGAGTITLTADEAKRLRGWADGLWKLAPKGSARFDGKDRSDIPRWVWGIVLRRGDEVRVLSGGGMSPPDNAVDPAKSALEWLDRRVDTASEKAP